MNRLSDYNKYKLTEDQNRRMNHGSAIILGAAAVAIVITLVIYSLPDWGWVVDQFWNEHVLGRGGYDGKTYRL